MAALPYGFWGNHAPGEMLVWCGFVRIDYLKTAKKRAASTAVKAAAHRM